MPHGGQPGDPWGEFFERFFGQPLPEEFKSNSLGSGFIINQEGYVLTNNHVVKDATDIRVKLSDGREFKAKVVGRDPAIDVGLIKLEDAKNLPTVVLGDSDRLEQGDFVLAMGNPFNLNGSVSFGIVSAKDRPEVTGSPFDDFIQTDAAINPGNSGGPLFNLRGEVVGINTAIFSQSGGNIGIGFAIPTNSIKELLPQLKDKGKVVRGYLGMKVQKVTPEITESLGLKQTRGALVAEVLKGGPAELAGVKPGDVIIELDRKEVKDSSELPIEVARVAPGTRLELKLWRNGKEV